MSLTLEWLVGWLVCVWLLSAGWREGWGLGLKGPVVPETGEDGDLQRGEREHKTVTITFWQEHKLIEWTSCRGDWKSSKGGSDIFSPTFSSCRCSWLWAQLMPKAISLFHMWPESDLLQTVWTEQFQFCKMRPRPLTHEGLNSNMRLIFCNATAVWTVRSQLSDFYV